MAGKFITIEGGEGAGKSTNIEFIRARLAQAGIEVCVTREPGGTRLGEELRELLIKPRDDHKVDPMAELLMIFAARSQHIAEVIQPALDRGMWVVSDRFTDATYAYQGCGRALGIDTVAVLEQLVQGELRPDHTLILDLPTDAGMRRVNDRAEPDRFEQEKMEFFEKIRSWYRALPETNPQRYTLIDAGQSLPDVQHSILLVLDDMIDRLDQS